MKRVKRKYKNSFFSSANIKRFNTDDITDDMILFYEKNGFAFLFETVKPKAKKVTKTTKEDNDIS